MKKRILIATIMLLLLSSCKGKSQFVVDAKYTPYYNFSIALGETKYFSIVGIKTDEDIFTEMRNHNEGGDSTYLTNKIKLVGENIDCFKVKRYGNDFVEITCIKPFEKAKINEVKIKMENKNYYCFPSDINISFDDKQYEEGNFVPNFIEGNNITYNATTLFGTYNANYDQSYTNEVFFVIKPSVYFKQETSYTINNVYIEDENISLSSISFATYKSRKNNGELIIKDFSELEYESSIPYTCTFSSTYSVGLIIKLDFKCDIYPDADVYGCDVNFDVTINGKRNTYNRLINVFRQYDIKRRINL